MARAYLLVAVLSACTRSDPSLTVDAALDFGHVAVDSVTTKTVKVTNPNDYAVVVDSFDNTGDPAFIAQFIPHRLLPGETLEIAVHFFAGAAPLLDEHETTFRLAWGDDSVAEVNVTGTTVFVDCSPRSVELGNVLVGDTATASLIVVNESPLETIATVSDLRVPSMNQLGFDGGGSYALLPGQALELPITFHPTSEGGSDARINVTAHALCPPVDVRVHGQGVNQLIGSFPGEMHFGRVQNGETLVVSLQVTNRGLPPANLTISPGDFSFFDGGHTFAMPGARIIEGTEGPFVAAAFEFVRVAFTPQQSGARSAQMTSDARGPFTCNLDGIGY